MKWLFFKLLMVLLMLFSLNSCKTINIKEQDAFDAKKTVTADLLKSTGIAVDEITFQPDDTTLIHAWYLTREDARGTVLYLGGNGFLLAIAGDILGSIYEQGMNVFAFDYRGYGQSSGRPSVDGLKHDAQAAYQYITTQKQIHPDQLIIHGHSMGSMLALWLANQNPAAGVVLESPVTDVKDLTDRLVPFFLKPFISFKLDEELLQVSNREEIKKLEKPVLIITGEDDQVTPKEMAEDLYKKAVVSRKNLYIIEDGGHNDLPLKNVYKEQLAIFYNGLLEPGLTRQEK